MENKNTEEEVGREVKENNQKIVHCLMDLRTQREDLIFLIQKQLDERKRLEMEMERLTYKVCLINKSMSQRLKAKQNYDVTIEEIEEKYKKLKENSGELRSLVSKDCDELDSMLNKKTSTEDFESTKEDAPSVKEEITSIKEEITSVKEETPSVKDEASDVKEETASTNEKGSGVKEADIQKVTANPVNAIKAIDEECVCLPNKDGKCIREKMLSKMVQAAPVDLELPIKLEKEIKIERHSDTSKQSEEKFAQTAIVGEPDTTTDDEDEDYNKNISTMNRGSAHQREMNLRKSK